MHFLKKTKKKLSEQNLLPFDEYVFFKGFRNQLKLRFKSALWCVQQRCPGPPFFVDPDPDPFFFESGPEPGFLEPDPVHR